MLTDAEALEAVRRHFESLFPRSCPTCDRVYPTLREYVSLTRPIGPPRSWDADLGDWEARIPVGSHALANCTCGSTLALSTEGMGAERQRVLLDWLQQACRRRGLSPTELLEWMRAEIRREVLEGPA